MPYKNPNSPEARASLKRRQDRYRAKNRERRNAEAMVYHFTVRSTPESKAAAVVRTRVWRQRNPDKNAANAARRYAWKKNQTVGEAIVPREVFERDGYECHICEGATIPGSPCHSERPTVDHLVPLCLGGEHSWDNVATAHWSCNASKKDKV